MYVFPIKKCFYEDYEKTNLFGDFNIGNDKAVIVFTLFQLMLHVTSVASKRVPVSVCYGADEDFPFKMFVESLVDDDGINVEWRVFIFEKIESEALFSDLPLVFKQAVNSGDFKLTVDGIYCKNADADSYAKKSMMNLHGDSIAEVLPKELLFKKIKNQDILSRWLRAYLIMCGLSNIDSITLACESTLTTLPSCFSLKNAISVTSQNVCRRQRLLKSYIYVGDESRNNNNNNDFGDVNDLTNFMIDGRRNGLYLIGRSLVGEQFFRKEFFESRIPKIVSLAEKALNGFILALTTKRLKHDERNKKISKLISKEFNQLNIHSEENNNNQDINSPALPSPKNVNVNVDDDDDDDDDDDGEEEEEDDDDRASPNFTFDTSVKAVTDIFEDYGINKLNTKVDNSPTNVFKDDKVYTIFKYL